MSLSIQENETELVLFYPKSNDLEIKMYNPHFWESLGFQNVTVSVVQNPSLEKPEPKPEPNPFSTPPSENPSSTMEWKGGEAKQHAVSFPYNQFMYLLKGNPEQPSTVDKVFQQYSVSTAETEKRPAGIYGIFYPTLDNLYKTFFGKKEVSAAEPVKSPEIEPEKTETNTETSSSILSSITSSVETNPTETKESSSSNSMFSSLFSSSSSSPKEEIKTSELGEQKLEEVISVKEIEHHPETEELHTTDQLSSVSPSSQEVETSIPEQPKQEPVVSPEEPNKEMKPTENADNKTNIPAELEPQKTETETNTQDDVKAPDTSAVAVVPIIDKSSLGEGEVKKDGLYWKIVISKTLNLAKVFEPSEIAERYEQHFRDVLLQSRIETKLGIYISGSFYSILGRKVKIGTVEQKSSSKNTLRDYLQTVPELEGSIMSKYKKMIQV